MLTNYNGKAITYDAIGNPLNWRNAFMLEWYGRNLIAFAKPTGEMYAYTYNADGIRTSKNYYNAGGNLIGTDEYIYDGTKLIAENRSGTWLYYFYDANGAVTGMSYGGTLYYFRKNLQGDVTGIYNATGTLVVEYEYTPYGALLAVTDANGNDVSANANHIANINPFRYRGYYYDTETGFYYLQSRYYDPVVGRFINADDIAMIGMTGSLLSVNLYAYCENNSVNNVDILGFVSISTKIISKGKLKVTINLSDGDIRKIKLGIGVFTVLFELAAVCISTTTGGATYGISTVAATIAAAAVSAVSMLTLAYIDYKDYGKGARIEFNVNYGTLTYYVPIWKTKYFVKYIAKWEKRSVAYAYISSIPKLIWNK